MCGSCAGVARPLQWLGVCGDRFLGWAAGLGCGEIQPAVEDGSGARGWCLMDWLAMKKVRLGWPTMGVG